MILILYLVIFWRRSNTLIWNSVPLSDAIKQTNNNNKKCWTDVLVMCKERHVPVKTHKTISSATPTANERTKHLQFANSLSRNEVVFLWASIHISHNWQSNGILRCRMSKQTVLFSIQTELKTFPEMSVQHGNKLLFSIPKKKISFTTKGAFNCDLRRIQMGFWEELQFN